MTYLFFNFIGIFVRWIFEYGCTIDKVKLKELTQDNKNKNLKYSIASYIIIILIFFALQYFNII